MIYRRRESREGLGALGQLGVELLLKPGRSLTREETCLRFSNYVCLLLSLLAFCLYSYFDSRLLTVRSLDFWHCLSLGQVDQIYSLFPGDLNQYYTGGLLALVLRAVWNLPVWLLSQGLPAYADSALALLWGRGYQLFFFVWTLSLVRQLALLLGFKRLQRQRLLSLLLSGTWFFTSVFYFSSSDIIWIFFALLCFKYSLEGRVYQGAIFAALAIHHKPFFAAAYLLLLCCTERQVLRFLNRLLLCFFSPILERYLLSFWPSYREALVHNSFSPQIDFMKGFGLGLSGLNANLLLLLFLSIFLYALFAPRLDLQRQSQTFFFRLCLMAGSYLVFFDQPLYRYSMLLPWLYFLLVAEKRRFGELLAVDTGLGFAAIWLSVLKRQPSFDLVAFRNSLLLPLEQRGGGRYDFGFQVFGAWARPESLAFILLSTCTLLWLLYQAYLIFPKRGILYRSYVLLLRQLLTEGGEAEGQKPSSPELKYLCSHLRRSGLGLQTARPYHLRQDLRHWICRRHRFFLLLRPLVLCFWMAFSLYLYWA